MTHEGTRQHEHLEGTWEVTARKMAPWGQALHYPAGPLLQEWELYGCPTHTGKEWSREEMSAAIERGPHQSALTADAMMHFAHEIKEKVNAGQAKVVLWDDIKDSPPPQLKISPIAAIPHKSKSFRSILDLSFSLRLKNGGAVQSVNNTTEKNRTRRCHWADWTFVE